MPAYILVDVTVNDPERYEGYKPMVPPTLEIYGGKFLVRGGESEVLEGDWQPNRTVVLEFESMEKAKAWHASEEYREARDLRQATTTTSMFVVNGV